MHHICCLILLVLCLGSAACGGQATAEPPLPIPGAAQYADPATYRSPAFVALGLYVQPHAEIDENEILRGYNWWKPVGFEAFLTDEAHADVLVTANDKPCEPNGHGDYVVGRGWSEGGMGFIELFPQCFRKENDGSADPVLLSQMAAHEGGHVLGMLHVPFHCDGSDERNPVIDHPNGTPICGQRAVMNPAVHYTLQDITPYDLLNFDVRVPGGMYPTGLENGHEGVAARECVVSRT